MVKQNLIRRFVGLLCWEADMMDGFHLNGNKGDSVCSYTHKNSSQYHEQCTLFRLEA